MKRAPFLWYPLGLVRFGGVLSLASLTACSSPTPKETPIRELPASVRQAFILRQVYSDTYCFRHRYYWKDSLANVRDICRVQAHSYDSVNHVLVERHGWTGEFCDKNCFLVIRQGPQLWFVPLCEENILTSGTHHDTTFFKTNLVITEPLNRALRGLVLKNRPLFLAHLFAQVFSQRLTRATYASYQQVLDARTKAYLRPRLDSPHRYYYPVPGGGLAFWEFDDTRPERLHISIIRPTWYECFAM